MRRGDRGVQNERRLYVGDICDLKGMEQDSKAVEIPTQEEMEKQKDLIKQLAEAGQEVAAGIEDLLKEMFNGE